jgi:hypothetical protein
MGDVHDDGFRIDLQDDALQYTYQVIVCSVIGRQSNDWIAQGLLPLESKSLR